MVTALPAEGEPALHAAKELVFRRMSVKLTSVIMSLPGTLGADNYLIDGAVVIRVYGANVPTESDRYTFLRTLLMKQYQASVSQAPNSSCVIVLGAETEFEGSALFRALMGVWNLVTDRDARIAVVGYPANTCGQSGVLPPLLPNLALARDLACALEWIRLLEGKIAGGNYWPSVPGVSYGRSLLPGEKRSGEWESFGIESP